ncbi:exported hypothetical protein [Gammaproteobacteria bacterium]
MSDIMKKLLCNLLFFCGYILSNTALADTVQGDYANNPKISSGDSATAMFFNGHISTLPNESGAQVQPKDDKGYALPQSSLGQVVSMVVPYPGFQEAALKTALMMLYYDKSDNSETYPKEKTAFRYKDKQYLRDGEDLTFPTMEKLWTIEEQNRAKKAAQVIKDALRYDPTNIKLQNSLLDIYYDTAVANMMVANEKMLEVQKAALGLITGSLYGKFCINDEIARLVEALPLFKRAKQDYFELFKDRLGIDLSRIGISGNDSPFGYFLFKERVKERFLDTSSESIKTFSGYKDFVLLYEIEREYSRAVAKLAKLYALRRINNGDSDIKNAHDVIDEFTKESSKESSSDSSILNGIYPEITSSPKPDMTNTTNLAFFNAKSGWDQGLTELSGIENFLKGNASRAVAKLAKLYALRRINNGDSDIKNAHDVIDEFTKESSSDSSILNGIYPEITSSPKPDMTNTTNLAFFNAKSGWDQGLTELSGIENFLKGNAKPLGLDQESLALIHPGLITGNMRDSYDYFQNELIPDGVKKSLRGPLGDAFNKLEEAKLKFNEIKMSESQISAELQAQQNLYDRRLHQIVGASFGTHEYSSPKENSGGEIAIQLQQIEIQKLFVEKKNKEIENLKEQINIEIKRRKKEHKNNISIKDVYIKYGRSQSELTREIGLINATQAWFNGQVAAANSITPWGAVANADNAWIQAGAELGKGFLQAEKERLLAAQNAKITVLQDNIADANSDAVIKNLWLGMKTLNVDMLVSTIQLSQEINKLQVLVNEKEYLEARRSEARKELAGRYFADPSHRIILNQYIIAADFAFREAQLWTFFLARAFDYKWNKKIAVKGNGNSYVAETVFLLRNADELQEMAKAFYNYNNDKRIGVRTGDHDPKDPNAKISLYKFSLRNDILKLEKNKSYNKSFQNYIKNTTLYRLSLDDILDDISKLEENEKYEEDIKRFQNYLKNISPQKPTGSGMDNYPEAVVIEFDTIKETHEGFFSPGRWNEKIRSVSIDILTNDAKSNKQVVSLTQHGIGFLRNAVKGSTDPNDQSIIKNEMTSYPIRYWYHSDNLGWLSKKGISITVEATLAKTPDENPKANEFYELPVASFWTLEIPLKDNNGKPVISLDSINDIVIRFQTSYMAPRQDG